MDNWILPKDRSSKQNLMPADEDTRINDYIPERIRSAITLKPSSGRICQRLVNTRLYIIRNICKVAFSAVADKSSPPRAKFVKPAWSALPFRSQARQSRMGQFFRKYLGIK